MIEVGALPRHKLGGRIGEIADPVLPFIAFHNPCLASRLRNNKVMRVGDRGCIARSREEHEVNGFLDHPPLGQENERSIHEASIQGDRDTLVADSVIPAGMALIYLMLLFYFKTIGGYKAIHIVPVEEQEEPDA